MKLKSTGLHLLKTFAVSAPIVLSCLALPSPSFAIVAASFSGDTTGKSLWNRPNANGSGLSASGTSVPYEFFSFNVALSGEYTVKSFANWDAVIFVYGESFDPSSPLTGFLAGRDAGNPETITINLLAGQRYHYVQTGFSNQRFGPYDGTFEGPGSVTIGAVEVPGPIPFLGMAAGFHYSRKLRKRISLE